MGDGSAAPQPWPPRGTHVDELQLPEVLHSVDGAVATGQERVDILLQPQRVQPGGHGEGADPVIAKGLHLQCEAGTVSLSHRARTWDGGLP